MAATVGKINSGYESQDNFLRIADISLGLEGQVETPQVERGGEYSRQRRTPYADGQTWKQLHTQGLVKGKQGWNPSCRARNDGK